MTHSRGCIKSVSAVVAVPGHLFPRACKDQQCLCVQDERQIRGSFLTGGVLAGPSPRMEILSLLKWKIDNLSFYLREARSLSSEDSSVQLSLKRWCRTKAVQGSPHKIRRNRRDLCRIVSQCSYSIIKGGAMMDGHIDLFFLSPN